MGLTRLSDKLIKFVRNKLRTSFAANTVSAGVQLMNTSWVSVYEFQNAITNKPDPGDTQTWDWAPAFNAAVQYLMSYDTVVLSGKTHGLERSLYVPGGLYKTWSEIYIDRYMDSNGTFASTFKLVGESRTSSVIQPMTEGQVGIRAQRIALDLFSIGFRAGASYQTGAVLGNETEWQPCAHCTWRDTGFSGFSECVLAWLLFDSTFIDIFLQNITPKLDGSTSTGFNFGLYKGPQNGGTWNDGSGDVSNNITFIRPTIETSSDTVPTVFLKGEGRNQSYSVHNVNVFGGHIETHNRRAKVMSGIYCYHWNFYSTIFSQNGNEVIDPTELMYLENCFNISFNQVRILQNNKVAAYNDALPKMIRMVGNTSDIHFNQCYFSTPFSGINGYHGLEYVIDYSAAALRTRAFTDNGCKFDSFQRPGGTSKQTLVDRFNGDKRWTQYVTQDGRFMLSYSTDASGTIAPTDLMYGNSSGDWYAPRYLQAGQRLIIGSGTDTTTKGISWQFSSTNVASIDVDSVGRIYLKPVVATGNQWSVGSTQILPSVTATMEIGSATFTVKNITLQNAPVVISDANRKTIVSKVDEDNALMQAWGSVDFYLFYMKEAQRSKSEFARKHAGLIAQEVRDALVGAGLSVDDYSLIGLSEERWEVEEVDGKYKPVGTDTFGLVLDDDGYIVPDQDIDVFEDGQLIRKVYHLRMEECLVVELAYQRWLKRQ